MSQMLPPGLMDALQGAGAGPAGTPMGMGDYGEPPDEAPAQNPLQTLQALIQQMPSVIAALPDARDTQDAIRALQILAGIQTRLSAGGGGGGGNGGGSASY